LVRTFPQGIEQGVVLYDPPSRECEKQPH
jgi:hypothetical protein